MHTENKRSREQEKRKRKPTGMDDGTVQKVAKQTLSGDATSNSETPKKKKRKLKKGTSGHTKGGVLETVSGGSPPRHKRHVTVDVMGDVEAESADNAPVTFIGIRKIITEAKRKRKRKTDDLKHSAEIATSIKNDLDSTSANLPPTATCVKGKAAARPASAATAVKKRSQYPFSIARLKSVFQHEATNTSNVSRDVPETEDASKTQENATKCKSDGNVPAQSSSPPQTLRERMQQKLNSARFRYINEQLYRRTGEEAHRLFTEDPETFQVYHEGYQSQIAKWPVNPVNKVIEYISSRPASLVVADLGCGDAKVSRAVPNRIHSFDLVAVNDSVTACDITQVPLEDNSVDIAVFCLSLMGTDFVQFLCEANRILRLGGKLLVAEVVSRFDKIGAFVRKLTKLGFSLQDKDTSNTMFVWFEFMKIGKPDLEKLPKIVLMPCVYKKR